MILLDKIDKNWEHMFKFQKLDIEKISYRTLIHSLYLTQLLLFFIALIIFIFFYRAGIAELWTSLLPTNIGVETLVGLLFAALVILINYALYRLAPAEMLDDGGINKKIFLNTPVYHIAFIAVLVAFVEELLFRVFIQSLVGVLATSVIFTLIHYRYFNKIILITFTFLTSLGLGLLMYYYGFYAVFLAHFLIDFVLGSLIRARIVE